MLAFLGIFRNMIFVTVLKILFITEVLNNTKNMLPVIHLRFLDFSLVYVSICVTLAEIYGRETGNSIRVQVIFQREMG
jgi:hypothetical protein